MLSDVHHSASRTFTTNQPSLAGARPEPESSSRASGTARVYGARDEAPILEVVNKVIVRPPTLADAHSIAALIAERDRVDFGEVAPIAFTGDELREVAAR